ncbi:MAG: TSUP family transporter, partial [Acidobacteriota bacterium]
GVGFFFLAMASKAGLDLVRGNALKVLCVLAFTPISLAIFAWHGQVAWRAGLALGLGTVLGGLLGVRLSVERGHRWIRTVVTVTVIALAVKLCLGG